MKNLLWVVTLFCLACAHSGSHVVSQIIDGDTVELDGSQVVRFVGVDCPESHRGSKLKRDAARSGQSEAEIQVLGQQASDFTAALVLGKKVFLEYDERRRDRFGRVLGYIFLRDGTFVNQKLVEAGFARTYLKAPFRYLRQFEAAEKAAKAQRLGLWWHGNIP